MTALTRKRSSEVIAPAPPSKRLVVIAAALVVAALILGFVGSRVLPGGSTALVVTQELTGVVSKVNSDQTHICMTVGNSPEAVCSGLWLPDGTAFPPVGSRISVWVVKVPTARGSQDMFILQPNSAPN